MADLRAPLLFERREAEVIVDVSDGGAEANGAVDRSPVSGSVEVPENPFEFIGSDFPPLQLNRFVDPFRNHTLSIGGAYELFKMLVMVPFTLIQLVIYGLSLLVGFIATKIALYGWKDKQRFMPRWRCRINCFLCPIAVFGSLWRCRIYQKG